MLLVHFAYLVILGVAWTWGISQAVYAVRDGWEYPPPWRVFAGVWLLGKAVFLTYLGYFVWNDMDGHAFMVTTFAVIHAAAFVKWLTLPVEDRTVAEPPIHTK
jgi:hypothetical protein